MAMMNFGSITPATFSAVSFMVIAGVLAAFRTEAGERK